MHGTCSYPHKLVRNGNSVHQHTNLEERAVKVEIPLGRATGKEKSVAKKHRKTCSYDSYIKDVVFGDKKVELNRKEILENRLNKELVGEGIRILKMNDNEHFNLDLFHQVVGLFDSIQTSNGENLFKLAEQIEDIKNAIYPENEGEMVQVKRKVKAVNNTVVNSVIANYNANDSDDADYQKIGRKLLSIEEKDNDEENNSAEDEPLGENYPDETSEKLMDNDDIESISNAETHDHDANEDHTSEEADNDYDYDYDSVDDFDLLDEESLTSMLNDYEEMSEKLQVIKDLIDTLETKIASKNDEELQTSAIQSLIVYLYAMEDLKLKVANASSNDKENFNNLNIRLNNLKETHLKQVTHLETFVEKAWSIFLKLLDEDVIQTFKRNDVINLINEFVFNFHYASEIEKIIIRRNIPDELDMITGDSDDIKVMTKFYKTLGIEPEVHDEGYFSQALQGFVSDGDEEELDASFQSRNLLSVKEDKLYGHCSKDDPDCESEERSVFSEVRGKSISTTLPPKVSTVESIYREPRKQPILGLDRCKDFLARTEEFSNNPEILEENMGKMSSSQKIKAIKHFLSQMKKSQKMLEEYKSIQESIEDPQDYQKCHKMLKAALAAIQSQASNTKWMGHLTSLMASHDPQVINQLKDILTPENQDEDDQGQFQSRKLLSIEEDNDEYCDKSDEDCGSAQENLYLHENNVNGEDVEQSSSSGSSDKDKNLVDELKKELDEAFEESKSPKKMKSESNSAVERCQALLVSSKKYLKGSRKDTTLKDIQTMNPKQKVKALKSFMARMTKSKELLDEYQDITSSMKDHSDIQLCQPILKEAMGNLAEIQAHAGNTEWMGHMSSLLESNDPDVLRDLNDIMANKMN